MAPRAVKLEPTGALEGMVDLSTFPGCGAAGDAVAVCGGAKAEPTEPPSSLGAPPAGPDADAAMSPEDQAMFNSVFGSGSDLVDAMADEMGLGHADSSTGVVLEGSLASASAGLPSLSCHICGSTSDDRDLSDPCDTRLTPFSRARLRRSSANLCDHCDNILRTRFSDSSPAEVARDGSKKDEFLRYLAGWLALKKSETSARVQRVTLDKSMLVLSAFAPISEAIRARAGVEHAPTSDLGMSSMSGISAFGLKDYLRSKGNPLTNNDIIAPALVDDRVRIVVLSKGQVPAGRSALSNIVRQACGDFSCASLTALANMTTDCADHTNLVAHLTSEFVSRARLLGEIESSLAPPRHTSDGQGGCGRSQASGQRRQATASDSRPDDEGEADEDEDENEEAEEDEDERLFSGPDDRSDAATSMRDASISTPPAKATRRAPASAASASPTASGSATTPLGCRGAFLAATAASAASAVRPGGGRLTSPRTQGRPPLNHPLATTPLDTKSGEKLMKKVFDHSSIFARPDWRKLLRGKALALSNMKGSIDAEVEEARKRRREDRIPALTHLKKVIDSLLVLGAIGVNKPHVDISGLLSDAFGDIEVVNAFLKDNHRRFGQGDGHDQSVFVDLERVEVVGPVFGGGYVATRKGYPHLQG